MKSSIKVQDVLKDTFSEKGPGSITCEVNAKVLKIINNSGLEKAAASASDGDIQKIADMFTRNIKLMNKGVDNINCDIKKGGAKSRSKKGGDNVSPSDMFLVGENTSSKSGGARGGMPRASRRTRTRTSPSEEEGSDDDTGSEEEVGPPQTPQMFPGNGQSTGTGFGNMGTGFGNTGTGFGNTNPNAGQNPFSNTQTPSTNTQPPSTNTQPPSTDNEGPRSGFESRAQAYPASRAQLVRRPAAVNAVAPLDQQLMDGAMEAVAALDNYDFMSMMYLALVTGTFQSAGLIAATIDSAVGGTGWMIGLTPLADVCGIGSNAARRHVAGWLSVGPECQVAQGQWEVLIMGMAVMTSTILIILSARSARRIASNIRNASPTTVIMELSMTGVTVVANQLRGCERGEVSPPIEERSSIMQILISPINGIANLSGRLFRAAGGLFRSNPELLVAEPTNQPQAITSVAAPAPSPAPTSAPTPAPTASTPIGRTTGTTNGVEQNQMSEQELRAARVAHFDNANSPNDSTGGRNKRRTRRRKSKASKKQRKTRRKISKKARKTKKAKKSKKSKKAKKSRKLKK